MRTRQTILKRCGTRLFKICTGWTRLAEAGTRGVHVGTWDAGRAVAWVCRARPPKVGSGGARRALGGTGVGPLSLFAKVASVGGW